MMLREKKYIRGSEVGTPVSSTNKTDCHNITEILLKVVLNAITLTLISKLDPLDLTTFVEVTDQ
jgi:hypothetical protein